jgi:hypothetical protein
VWGYTIYEEEISTSDPHISTSALNLEAWAYESNIKTKKRLKCCKDATYLSGKSLSAL